MRRRDVLAILVITPLARVIPDVQTHSRPQVIGIPVCSCKYHMLTIKDNIATCVNEKCENFGKKFKAPIIPLEPCE
jgi:hypothetical protein